MQNSKSPKPTMLPEVVYPVRHILKLLCPQPQMTACPADWTSATSLCIVTKRCAGRQSCQFSANNGVFGDPCAKTWKYLEVKYRCVTAEVGQQSQKVPERANFKYDHCVAHVLFDGRIFTPSSYFTAGLSVLLVRSSKLIQLHTLQIHVLLISNV